MNQLFLAALLALFATATIAQEDPRYCGPPKRDARGVIVRSSAVLRQFQALNHCPSTHAPTGACPGWIKDHVRPLAACGCDSIGNLQWLPVEMWRAKSLWERVIYTCRAV